MDQIENRLREAAEACLNSYAAWRKDEKNSAVREDLMERVHELRKVAARLEIEMAISERNQMTSKPIPIPPHRASRKPTRNQPPAQGHDDDFNAENTTGGDQEKPKRAPAPRQRRKRASGGSDSGNSTE